MSGTRIRCCAFGCFSTDKMGKRFFRFPRNPTRRKQWLETMHINKEISNGSRICEDHFDVKQFEPLPLLINEKKLKGDALPTILKPLEIIEATLNQEPLSPESVKIKSEDGEDGGYTEEPSFAETVEIEIKTEADDDYEDGGMSADPLRLNDDDSAGTKGKNTPLIIKSAQTGLKKPQLIQCSLRPKNEKSFVQLPKLSGPFVSRNNPTGKSYVSILRKNVDPSVASKITESQIKGTSVLRIIPAGTESKDGQRGISLLKKIVPAPAKNNPDSSQAANLPKLSSPTIGSSIAESQSNGTSVLRIIPSGSPAKTINTTDSSKDGKRGISLLKKIVPAPPKNLPDSSKTARLPKLSSPKVGRSIAKSQTKPRSRTKNRIASAPPAKTDLNSKKGNTACKQQISTKQDKKAMSHVKCVTVCEDRPAAGKSSYPLKFAEKAKEDEDSPLVKRMEKMWKQNMILKRKLLYTQKELSRIKKSKICCEDAAGRLQDVFQLDQIASLMRHRTDSRGHKWSEETIESSIQLRKICGIKGYEELVRRKYPLPSDKSIRRHLLKTRKKDEAVDSGENTAEAEKKGKEEETPAPLPIYHQPGGVYLYKVGDGYRFGPLPNDESAPICPTVRKRIRVNNVRRHKIWPKTALAEDVLPKRRKELEAEILPKGKKKVEEEISPKRRKVLEEQVCKEEKGGFEEEIATNLDEEVTYVFEDGTPVPPEAVYRLQQSENVDHEYVLQKENDEDAEQHLDTYCVEV